MKTSETEDIICPECSSEDVSHRYMGYCECLNCSKKFKWHSGRNAKCEVGGEGHIYDEMSPTPNEIARDDKYWTHLEQ